MTECKRKSTENLRMNRDMDDVIRFDTGRIQGDRMKCFEMLVGNPLLCEQ